MRHRYKEYYSSIRDARTLTNNCENITSTSINRLFVTTNCMLVMAILKTCCCWSSLRKGSYASAVYAMVYHLGCVTIMGMSIHDDWEYYWGVEDIVKKPIIPKSSSFLEPNGMSHITMICILVIFTLSICGLFTSILLCIGLFFEISALLIPWLFNIMITSTIDISHSFHWLIQPRADFSPIAATLFTFEIFIILLNIYAFLCVYSQYQEYKAGRGTAAYDDLLETIRRREQTVSMSARGSQQQTTATSYLTGISQSARESTTVALDNLKIRKVQFPDEEESVIEASPTKLRIGHFAAPNDRMRDARITDLKEEDDNYAAGRDYLWPVTVADECSLICDTFTARGYEKNDSSSRKHTPAIETVPES